MSENRPMSTKRPLRVGMLTPSSNTCLEPVTYGLLHGAGGAATAHFARVPVTRIALDAGSDAQFDPAPMLAAARQLADAKVDVLVWNGTSGSWLGIERDRALAAALTAETGIPATTSTLALLDACAAYGVTRLGLALPYTRDVAEAIVATYAKEGLECVLAEPFGEDDNEAFARIPAADVAGQIERAAGDGAHAVAVVCTNVYGAFEAERLEPALGVPVFDSVTATLWRALGLAGAAPSWSGYGTLLRDGALRARVQSVLTELLGATGADRTTFRVDLPGHGLHVDLTAGEALGPGVRSIRRDASLDQRRLNTVAWLEAERRPLVQPHFRDAPHPPQALIDGYGVRAQMLSPVQTGGALTGWISVHSLREREWSAADQQALAAATAELTTRLT
ncbi:GAF domain-containing protein [Streptomyces sp. VRA16 Mangrove soil]|uniref:maleate cis-trans isomerase family protein n=1 Tax=Streptomyces sp. VRA16 Mangrove soil TaxID=2817434 RepID=UPI001A9D89B4|nr:GAF domain-containing protein [Streptomyces sp. VRA16 Mangrove soil]MBO1330879.1 GAF domain-containing protein [Streptomyces sp. VRA16 Mangrove soil]